MGSPPARRPLGSQRFGKGQRLRTPADFARVFADSQRSADAYFTVLGRVNSLTAPRLGLAISRRAARRAVQRNKLKRLAREAFRCRHDLPDWDFVVMAKPEAAKTDTASLRRSLDRHFERLTRRAGTAT